MVNFNQSETSSTNKIFLSNFVFFSLLWFDWLFIFIFFFFAFSLRFQRLFLQTDRWWPPQSTLMYTYRYSSGQMLITVHSRGGSGHISSVDGDTYSLIDVTRRGDGREVFFVFFNRNLRFWESLSLPQWRLDDRKLRLMMDQPVPVHLLWLKIRADVVCDHYGSWFESGPWACSFQLIELLREF